MLGAELNGCKAPIPRHWQGGCREATRPSQRSNPARVKGRRRDGIIMVHHDCPVPLTTPFHCCTLTLFWIVVAGHVVSLSLAIVSSGTWGLRHSATGADEQQRWSRPGPARQPRYRTHGTTSVVNASGIESLPALETSAKRRQECKGCWTTGLSLGLRTY